MLSIVWTENSRRERTSWQLRDYKPGSVCAAVSFIDRKWSYWNQIFCWWLVVWNHPQLASTQKMQPGLKPGVGGLWKHPSHLEGCGAFPSAFLSLTTPYFMSPSPCSADGRLSPQVSPLSAVWFLQMSTRRSLCRWWSYPGLAGRADVPLRWKTPGPKGKYSTPMRHAFKPSSRGR